MKTFDPIEFKQNFPEFVDLNDTLLINVYSNNALIKSRWVYSYFTDENVQYYWSTVVLAHILTIRYNQQGGTNSSVGRISSASEGGVSASFEFNIKTESGSAYWNSTVYGVEVWELFQSIGVATLINPDD